MEQMLLFLLDLQAKHRWTTCHVIKSFARAITMQSGGAHGIGDSASAACGGGGGGGSSSSSSSGGGWRGGGGGSLRSDGWHLKRLFAALFARLPGKGVGFRV